MKLPVQVGLGDSIRKWHSLAMSTLTIALDDELETAFAQRVQAVGAASREDYLRQLVEDDCERGKIDAVLLERLKGPFVPFTPDEDWKERVRENARKLREG
jgi:hypothetical protein